MHPGRGGGRRYAICIALLCGLGPLTLPSALADSREAEVEFERGPRGHLLLPVSINGIQQGIFALDTGASRMVLTPDFARRIGAEPSADGTLDAVGAHASTEVTPIALASVEIGGAARRNVEAVVMDLSHVNGRDMGIDGVLGNSFLEGFDLLIDFTAASVEIAPAGTLARDGSEFDAWVDIGDGPGNLIYLDVLVNGNPMTAILDTGSGRSAINTAAATAMGLSVPDVPPPIGSHGDGGHGPVAALPAVSIDIGGTHLDGIGPVAIIDLDVFQHLGLGEKPALLIGTNLLTGRRVGIDYGSRRLYL